MSQDVSLRTAHSSTLLIMPLGGEFAGHFTRMAALATGYGLPSIQPNAQYALAGGLMAYGPSLAANRRRAAV